VVSGSLSSPYRGAFHLSLTVLVHYRSLKIFSLGGWSPQLPTRFHVPRGTQDPNQSPPPVSTGLSPALVARSNAFESAGAPVMLVLQPRLDLYRSNWFGLVPVRSPLLRESRLISLRRATEMFQFAHGPPPCLWIQHGVSRHHSGRVAPFGYSGLLARMQLPLNVSPVSASFIGLQRLGIHLVLCLACTSLPDAGKDIRWFDVSLFVHLWCFVLLAQWLGEPARESTRVPLLLSSCPRQN
jgi:hypothetical protein